MCLSGTVLFILTFLFNPHNNPNGGFSICMLQERKVLISPSLKVTQLVTESRLELLVRWNYFSLIFTYLYIYSSDHKLFKIWVYEDPSYVSSWCLAQLGTVRIETRQY